jgi:hypothetical protein
VKKLPVVMVSAHDAAEKIAQVARDTAPVLTGAYQAGIVVQDTKGGARVFASDYKSAWVEFGIPSRGQAAHFTLRRAAEVAGYTFKKRGA